MSSSRTTTTRILQQAWQSQQAWAKTAGTAGAFWLFPGLVTAAWLLFPALDSQWKQDQGWASDPMATVKRVQEEKMARMEAHYKAKGIVSPAQKAAKEDEEDEEEEEEEAAAEEEEEEAGPAEDEEDEGNDKGDDEEEDDDEEEEGGPPPPKPLYHPVKGKNLSPAELWDNFTIKAVRMTDDDDDDDDDEDDDDDDE